MLFQARSPQYHAFSNSVFCFPFPVLLEFLLGMSQGFICLVLAVFAETVHEFANVVCKDVDVFIKEIFFLIQVYHYIN